MTRGTFGNIRIKNQLAPGTEGSWTRYLPGGEVMSIYDAAMKYKQGGVPLMVIGGKEYGSGSSRDWAAKGTLLLGVRAVLAESFERIHRSNLAGMGVLPLQFRDGETLATYGLKGDETFDIAGIHDDMAPGADMEITAHRAEGADVSFTVRSRLDTSVDVKYYRNGGILQTVLRQLVAE